MLAYNQVICGFFSFLFRSGAGFCGSKGRSFLDNEHRAVNSSLLHGSWQETVLEDNLFTRQEVIAMLDLSAQPRKYQWRAWESLRRSRQLAITESTSVAQTMVSAFRAMQHVQR